MTLSKWNVLPVPAIWPRQRTLPLEVLSGRLMRGDLLGAAYSGVEAVIAPLNRGTSIWGRDGVLNLPAVESCVSGNEPSYQRRRHVSHKADGR